MKAGICKNLIIAFVIGLICSLNGFGQTTVTVYPLNCNWQTGYVNANYDKINDEIHVGKPTIGEARRGYIKFFIYDDIPHNATITSIQLKVWPHNPGGSEHHLYIHNLTYDPENANGQTLWNDIADGTCYYDGYALAGVEDQWVTISLNSLAVSDLQSKVTQSIYYWAIGLCEMWDNDNNSQMYGFSSSSYRPKLEVTYTIPCNTPQCTSASNITETSAKLNWNSSTGANSYNVRYRVSGGSWTSACSSTTSTYCNVTGLTCGTSYEYQVQANCSGGNTSSWSNSCSFQTSACPCNTPVCTSASNITETSAKLNWNSSTGANSYNVRYRVSGGSWTTACSSTTSTYCNVTGLTCGTSYEYQVQANCSGGNTSSWSNSCSFQTSACPCNTPVCTSASNITETSAKLNWTSSTGANSYNVRYRENGGSWTTACSNTTSTYCNVTGLNCGTSYEYQIQANCSGGNTSNWSNSCSFQTLDCPCNIPACTSASNITETSAKLNWNSSTGANSYNVRYRVSGGSWTTVCSNTTSTYCNVTGLTCSTSYEYQVQANCSGGNTSSWSNSCSFQTSSCDIINESFLSNLISIYPNPANNTLNIEIDKDYLSKTDINIYLYDVIGKLMKEINNNDIINNIIQINLTSFADGIYYLNIQTSDGSMVKKIVIQR